MLRSLPRSFIGCWAQCVRRLELGPFAFSDNLSSHVPICHDLVTRSGTYEERRPVVCEVSHAYPNLDQFANEFR